MSIKKIKPARIISLLTDAYGGHGGISRFNRDLLSALAVSGGSSELVVFPRLVPQVITEEIPQKISFINKGITTKAGYVKNLCISLLADRRYKFLICGHINMLTLSWLAARFLQVPLVLIVHGIDAWQPTRSRIINKLVPRVDLLVAVSETTIERVQEWSGVPAAKTWVLPNCVDVTSFTPGPKSSELVSRYRLAGRRVLLTLGRMAGADRYKGFDEVLEAMPGLVKDMPELVYMLAGDGPDKKRLVEKAEKLGIMDHVIFTGMVAEEEKVDHYRLADAYVMPSRGEGFGIVLLEAMSCGIPVLASKLDGSKDALRNGQLGILVDPTDQQDVVTGIKRVLAMPHQVPDGLDYFSQKSFEKKVDALLRAILVED